MKKLVIALVAVVVLAGGALYWFVIRDDAEPELTLTQPTDTTSANDGSTTTAPETLEGTWAVRSEEPTRAGLRIKESFLSGLADHTAVGRTSAVEGSLTIDGTTVTEGSFTVDLTSLEFTDSPPGLDIASRSRAMEDAGLQTNDFPTTTFELTEPIDLGSVPEVGEVITMEAPGELTLHGVTNSVTFEVEAQLIDGEIEIATADPVEVVLTDYDIKAPVQGPVAEVGDSGSFEFVVRLAKG